MHRQVARGGQHGKTLEIGAGTLNHLVYEPAGICYDIVEPFSELYKDSEYLSRIRKIFNDLDEADPSEKYDRIIAIAMFEHVLHLPKAVATTCLLLKPGGVLQVAIPNEGHLLWTLAWKLTTGLEFRLRHGLDYSLLMQYEHVNTADEIEKIVRTFYRRIKNSNLGLGKKLSFYRYYECSEPNQELAEKYLQTIT